MHTTSPSRSRISLAAVATLLSLALPVAGRAADAAPAPAPAPAAVHAFALVSQPLADALEKFSAITGVSAAARAELLAGKTAPALAGSYTAPEALDLLLAGSGLTHRSTGARSVAIVSADAPAASAAPATTEVAPAAGDLLLLEPVLVNSDGAQRVLVVTRADLDLRQANDLKDTLSIDPSVSVGGGPAIAQKIYVRNLGEGLLNISVDGATQTGSLFHHIGRTTLEPELLQQVEVQPGIGNATDGPGALGGAIRFVTKDPSHLLNPGERAGALVKQSYFSNTDGLKSSATGFGRANDTWSGLLSVVYSDHDNITDGNGDELVGTDSQQQVIFGKVVGEFRNGHTVRLSYENLQEEGNKLRRPEWAFGPGNGVFYMEAERNTGTVNYGFRPDEIEWIDLSFTSSYTKADLFNDGPWGPYYGSIEGIQFDLRNTHRIADHTLVYGIDHRLDEVTAGGPPLPRDHYSENAIITGLFTQGEFKLAERLVLNAGARYDIYRLDDRLGQEFRHEGFSPNLGATFEVTRDFSLSAGVATAYRGPGINDAFRVDMSTNDPDLDAERAVNYELRGTYKRNGFLFEAGGYINRIDDIITNTLPWSTTYVNAGRLETEGVFARASYTLGDVTAGLQFNKANTELNGQTATRYQYSSLVSSIGDTWVADIVWRPVDQLDLGWNMRLVQGIDDIEIPGAITAPAPATSIDKPGYTTHDVFLRWRPTFVKDLTVTLTVKNVFDKHYLAHGSVEDLEGIPGFAGVVGAPEAGRDIRVSVSLRF